MAEWRQFDAEAPELASFGRERFERARLAYLATTRADLSPRVHPVTPEFARDRLYVFMEPTSPKGEDLRRDDRYALHSAVEDFRGTGGEFLVRGRALRVQDAEERTEVAADWMPERWILFELGVDEAIATWYVETGTERQRWRATT